MRSYIRVMFLPVLYFVLYCTVSSSFAAMPDSLYAVRLKSVEFSEQSLNKAQKPLIGAGMTRTYIYCVVLVNGTRWYSSPKIEVKPNQLIFDWSQDEEKSAFAVPWSKDTRITIRAYVTDDGTDKAVTHGVAGAGVGASLGAIVGGIIAGIPSAGLAAPVGIGVGAAIGGVAGGAAGVTGGAWSNKDQVIVEKHFESSELFPLQGTIKNISSDGLGGKYFDTFQFKLTKTMSPVPIGGLQLNEKYLVKINTIHLSKVGSNKNKKNGEYYIILRRGKDKYPLNKDTTNLLKIEPGEAMDLNPSIFAIMNNTGEETEILIYRKNKLKDKLVFLAKANRSRGKNWVFQGKIISQNSDDKGSYVLAETLGPIK